MPPLFLFKQQPLKNLGVFGKMTYVQFPRRSAMKNSKDMKDMVWSKVQKCPYCFSDKIVCRLGEGVYQCGECRQPYRRLKLGLGRWVLWYITTRV